MDTKFIETLLKVIDYGSYADAARHLHVTPAAVRGRVQALEAELGVTLVNRAGQKVAPTQACLSIKVQLQDMLSQSRTIQRTLDANEIGNTFRLGAISTALVDFVPDVVKHFTQHASQAELHITPGTSLSLYEDLKNDRIDAAFMVHPPMQLPKSLDIAIIATQPLVMVTHLNDSRSIDDITKQEKIILYDGDSWGGKPIKVAIHKHIANPDILCEMDALETIATLVEKGLGYAVLPLWQGLHLYRVKQIPLGWTSRKIVLVHPHLPKQVQRLLTTTKN